MMNEEEKQPVDISKQPIVFGVCISLYLLHLFFLSIYEDKYGEIYAVFGFNFCKTVVWVELYMLCFKFFFCYYSMILFLC